MPLCASSRRPDALSWIFPQDSHWKKAQKGRLWIRQLSAPDEPCTKPDTKKEAPGLWNHHRDEPVVARERLSDPREEAHRTH